MKEIAWKDENKAWKRTVLKNEMVQLSVAFVVIYLVSLIICLATKLSLSHISFLVLFLYVMGLVCVVYQRWETYHYKVNEVELTVFTGKGKAESIDANNATVSSIKRFNSFNVIHLTKKTKYYAVYVSNDSEEWELLKSLLKITDSIHKLRPQASE